MLAALYILCGLWALLIVWLVHGVLTTPKVLPPPKDGDA